MDNFILCLQMLPNKCKWYAKCWQWFKYRYTISRQIRVEFINICSTYRPMLQQSNDCGPKGFSVAWVAKINPA